MAEVPFSCPCGKVAGTLADVSPRSGTHAVCYCASCRAGEIYSGGADPAPEPVDIYQTSPYLLTLAKGRDHLAVFSFGPKNLLRWKASCCGTAMFNTPRNPKMSFVGVRTSVIAQTAPLGPVVGKAFVPVPGKKPRHENLRAMLFDALARILGNRVSGRWKSNPLFDTDTGAPIHPVHVVSPQERAALPR